VPCRAKRAYHQAWSGRAKWVVLCPPNGLPARPKHGPAHASGRPGPVACHAGSCSCWAKPCGPRHLPHAKFSGLHVWLNMPIFFKMKVSSLVSYLGEGLALFYFVFFLWKMKASHLTSYFDEGFVFSLKNEGFARDFVFWRRFLWLHNLMKASYFGFVFWWRLLTLALYFDKGFTLWLRTVTNVSFFLRKRRFHTWLCILMKVSFFLWKMKASHLTSYIDKGFTL
jgi:hypothetical protein